MSVSDAVALPSPTRFALAGGFAVAVALASLLKAPAAPFAELGPLGLVGVDKWVHVWSYGLFTFLLAYAIRADRVVTLVAIGVLGVLFGVGVELVQSTIRWRTVEFADVVANAVGTAIALVAWRITWRLPVERPTRSEG